jgi:hypothetical protein
MFAFDLEAAAARAQSRFRARSGGRRQRSDVGSMRLHPKVAQRLADLLGGQERAPVADVLRDLQSFCRPGRAGRCPSRATIYKAMAQLVVHRYHAAALPESVRATLHNLEADAVVPGHQLVFCCFNYGGLSTMSHAAALPWLALYQAARMRGWRPRSRGLLLAVCRARGI